MIWISASLFYLTVIHGLGLSPGDTSTQPFERALWGLGVVAVALTVISGAEYVVCNRNSESDARKTE
jgi:hypothetical protein